MKKEISPVVLIGAIAAGVIALLAVIFFAFVKPKLDENRALAEFNTPEAQAKRDPDQRKLPEGLEAKINAIRAKEGEGRRNATGFLGRRSRE